MRVMGKGRRERVAFLSPKAVKAVDRYLRLRARHHSAVLPHLWLGQKGRMTTSGITQILPRRTGRRRRAPASAPVPSDLRPRGAVGRHTGGRGRGPGRLAQPRDAVALRQERGARAGHRRGSTHQRRRPAVKAIHRLFVGLFTTLELSQSPPFMEGRRRETVVSGSLTVRINGYERQGVDEGWIAQTVTGLRRAGEAVCIRVSIDSPNAKVGLTMGVCTGGGGGAPRPPNAAEARLIDAWRSVSARMTDPLSPDVPSDASSASRGLWDSLEIQWPACDERRRRRRASGDEGLVR